MKINEKTIIVTGGSNGIGQALILNLLSKSCKVIAADFSETVLQETFYDIVPENDKDRLLVFEVDITNKKSVEQFYEKVIFSCGTIDGVINNAGIIQPLQKRNGLRFNELERLFDINYHGMLYLANAFLPHLLSRPEACLVTSVGAFWPLSSEQSLRGLSQRISAIKMLTEGLHSELLGSNIKVVSIFSGISYADLGKKSYQKSTEDDVPYTLLSPLEDALKIIEAIEQGFPHVYLDTDSKQFSFLENIQTEKKKLYKRYKLFLFEFRNIIKRYF